MYNFFVSIFVDDWWVIDVYAVPVVINSIIIWTFNWLQEWVGIHTGPRVGQPGQLGQGVMQKT